MIEEFNELLEGVDGYVLLMFEVGEELVFFFCVVVEAVDEEVLLLESFLDLFLEFVILLNDLLYFFLEFLILLVDLLDLSVDDFSEVLIGGGCWQLDFISMGLVR